MNCGPARQESKPKIARTHVLDNALEPATAQTSSTRRFTFRRGHTTPRDKQIFNVAMGDCKAKIKPRGAPDDGGRGLSPRKRDGRHSRLPNHA